MTTKTDKTPTDLVAIESKAFLNHTLRCFQCSRAVGDEELCSVGQGIAWRRKLAKVVK